MSDQETTATKTMSTRAGSSPHHYESSSSSSKVASQDLPIASLAHDRESSATRQYTDNNYPINNFDDHDNADHADHDTTAIPKLPLPLSILYGMYGLTMSLPMLPMMYILNTRVPLPLSMLPTYGALAFMPYSFKPLYAYWSSFFPRPLLLSIGWGSCALVTLGWTVVPSVAWIFALGIGHGVVMAWSGFLLGLTLLDTAQCLPATSSSSSLPSTAASAEIPENNGHNFETAASVFQSQAATARNIGSFLASVISCFVFGISQRDQSQWSAQVVNGMFWATAGCHIISLLVVLGCRSTFSTDARRQSIASTTRILPTEAGTSGLSRQPSYAALEVCEGFIDEDVSDTDSEDSVEQQEQQQGHSAFMCSFNFMAVAFLQVSIILLALKGPILHVFSVHPLILPVVGGIAAFIIILLSVRLLIGNAGGRMVKEVRDSWGLSSMVGLVLIVRHSVPSSWAIFNSFLYHCFQSQPVWLQLLSLANSVVLTLASWSYQKLFAPHYSHGRKLIHFMMVTTVVTCGSNNLLALVVNFHDDDKSFDAQPQFLWLVLVVKMFTSFLSEWNFLPSVVLATVSIPGIKSAPPGHAKSNATSSTTTAVELDNDDEAQQVTPRTVPTVSSATNIAYGSLISCIDFGDQIGAILSTPLVAALGITRENNWQHLDRMIHICSVTGILSAGILIVLLRWFPKEPANIPGRRPPSPPLMGAC